MAGDSFRPARPGESIAARVGDRRWFDRVTKAAIAEEDRLAGGDEGADGREPSLLRIQNTHTEDVGRFAILEVEGSVFTAADEPALFDSRRPPVKATAPTGNGQPVITLKPLVSNGGLGEAVVLGWVQCDVNVTDASHQFAIVTPGDTAKLQSSLEGSIRILAKDAGTGVKRCLVMLGGGGNSTVILNGGDNHPQAIATIDGLESSQTSVTLNSVQGYFGAPAPASDPLTAENPDGWSLPDGGYVLIVQDTHPSGPWRIFFVLADATPSIRFELSQDLNEGDTTASGWLLYADDTRANTAGTLVPINVVSNGSFWGVGPSDTTNLNPTEARVSKRGSRGYVSWVLDQDTGTTRLELTKLNGIVPLGRVDATTGNASIVEEFSSGNNTELPAAPSLGHDLNMDALASVPLDELVAFARGLRDWVKFQCPAEVLLGATAASVAAGASTFSANLTQSFGGAQLPAGPVTVENTFLTGLGNGQAIIVGRVDSSTYHLLAFDGVRLNGNDLAGFLVDKFANQVTTPTAGYQQVEARLNTSGAFPLLEFWSHPGTGGGDVTGVPFHGHLVTNLTAPANPANGTKTTATVWIYEEDGAAITLKEKTVDWHSMSTRTLLSGKALRCSGVTDTINDYQLFSADCDDAANQYDFTPPS